MTRRPSKPEARHAARLAAVQALYQMDMAGTDLTNVIEEFTTYRFKQDQGEYGPQPPDATFFAELVRGVVRRQREIDPVVDQQLAIGWRLVRVDSIIRASLRAAMFELIDRPDVPARVVINEYINVAKAFFDDDGPKVVNGVLDRLARRYRPEEFAEKSGA
ncbi:MAG: transcription antitermination factor NusB [Hyphomicrobiaceae bacterium]|nr:transcription antitermination factor NusB [Hyphomicrobiaceae bacterium]